MTKGISTAAVAALLGAFLAAVAAFGIVQSQQSAGNSTDQSKISYNG